MLILINNSELELHNLCLNLEDTSNIFII